MKKLLFSSVLTFFIVASVSAQNYTSAIGARLGYPLSASFKYFMNESHALEAYVGTRGYDFYRWTNVSVGYQIHRGIDAAGFPEGFKWYYGAGGSIYFWSWDTGFGDGESNSTFGVQGYLGIEYTFEDIPLNVSVDWVPTFFINGFGSGFGGGYGALAARYVLGR